MADFIKALGPAFIPHLLRRLYDGFVRDIAEWYPEAGVTAPPRTHSTMLALDEHGSLGVTELAALLRQSHPLVLTWVRQLKTLGFVETADDPADGRRTMLRLTRAGRDELATHAAADAVVAAAFERLMRETDAEVFAALWRIEEACRDKDFATRLREENAIGVDAEISGTR